jgi:dienelactone hydrolase
MIIERTVYHPKPGQSEAVLAVRRRASLRRRAMRLPSGRIYVGETEKGSIVHWECTFRDANQHESDLVARGGDAEFGAIRREMTTLIDHFERCVLTGDGHGSEALLADCSLDDHPVAPRRLSFNSGGQELTGYLFLPPGPGPFPCMVTNHGSGLTQGSTEICGPGTAAVLMSAGIACFRPHRRGYGDSPGVPWRQEVAAEFGTDAYDRQLARRIDRESDDVVAALAAAEVLPEIQPGRVGVIGSSFGGIVSLLAASKSDRFQCAIDFAGAAMNWDRTPELRRTMIEAGRKLRIPLFLVQAANDYSIRPTREIAEALAGGDQVVEHRIYPGFGITNDEGHFLFRDGAALWWPDVRRFLERWL